MWHTHTCPVCGSWWTHIAPTPMTQKKNREIHTCTKCGTEVYAYVKLEEPGLGLGGVALIAAGAFAGLVLAHLIDRPQ
jgi:hypothetical protein